VQANKTADEYAQIGQVAEAYEFDVVSVFGDLLFQPPIVPLLQIARNTRRVQIGAACWNPYTMHPYEIAGQLIALDAASGGRAYLGLAGGTWLDVLGLSRSGPVAHLRDAVAVVVALSTGDLAGVAGEAFSLRPGTELRYRFDRRRPRIMIGAWGARIASLAGEVADEVKIGGTTNPAMIAVMRERIRVGSEAALRPPQAVGIVVGAVTVVDADGARARARARSEVAMYLAVVAALDPTAGVAQELIDDIAALVADGRHEAAGSLIPDQVLDLFAFSGTPDQVAAQAQRLIDAGASRVEFGTPHGLSDTGGIEMLGRDVLPLLRR